LGGTNHKACGNGSDGSRHVRAGADDQLRANNGHGSRD
jgi:hypothetical protein